MNIGHANRKPKYRPKVDLAPDLTTFFDEFDSLSNLDRLKRLKDARLGERPDQVQAIFKNPKTTLKFRDVMIVLSDAVTTPDSKRTEEQNAIFALVKSDVSK